MKSLPHRKRIARSLLERGVRAELGIGKHAKSDNALQMFRRAAILGDRQAQFFLAIQYAAMPNERGKQRLAAAWFKKAAWAGEELCELISQGQNATPEAQTRLFRELLL